MKADRLEKLYREKLYDLKIEPSEKAAKLFDERLSAKVRKLWVTRISIAASVLLVAVTGALLIFPDQEQNFISERSNVAEGYITQGTSENTGETGQKESYEIAAVKENDRAGSGPVELKNKKKTQSIEDEEADKELIPQPESITKSPELAVGIKDPLAEKTGNPDELMEQDTKQETIMANKDMPGNKPPVKITIEYIAGNSKSGADTNPKKIMKTFYSNVNNLLYPDEVLGDIRSLKDQLFALDLKNENKSETQNKGKK